MAVYCADCGHKLTHRQPSPNKTKVYDTDDAYVCGNYRQLTHDCSMHFIKTSALRDLILSAIREISTFVRSDEKEFSEQQQAISTQRQGYENPQRFIALAKRHTDFTELTTPMINEFIEKVIVHEATGDRAQKRGAA